jgi:hypothetical protein
MIISGCRKIVGGTGEGIALVTGQPINFLAMVDVRTGVVTDQEHEMYGKSVKGVVLVFPFAVGSSVGAYAIYSLRQYGSAPIAMVCSKTDVTTASGCAIAGIPTLELPAGMPLSSVRIGSTARVEADTGRIEVKV